MTRTRVTDEKIAYPEGRALLWFARRGSVHANADMQGFREAVVTGYYIALHHSGSPMGIECGGNFYPWKGAVVRQALRGYDAELTAEREQRVKARESTVRHVIEVTAPEALEVPTQDWHEVSSWSSVHAANNWRDHLIENVGLPADRVRVTTIDPEESTDD